MEQKFREQLRLRLGHEESCWDKSCSAGPPTPTPSPGLSWRLPRQAAVRKGGGSRETWLGALHALKFSSHVSGALLCCPPPETPPSSCTWDLRPCGPPVAAAGEGAARSGGDCGRARGLSLGLRLRPGANLGHSSWWAFGAGGCEAAGMKSRGGGESPGWRQEHTAVCSFYTFSSSLSLFIHLHPQLQT